MRSYEPCLCGGCNRCMLAQGVVIARCEGCKQEHELDDDYLCADCADAAAARRALLRAMSEVA